MAGLNAYLNLDGTCKQAMEFYKDCLGGDLQLMSFGESPMAAQTPSNMKDRVLHSVLRNGDMVLMASDVMDELGYILGNTVSLCLVCESKEEIESLFSKFSSGARSKNNLREEFFGTYGDLVDKYGMGWMFQFSEEQM
jgi:PhnB protein